MQERYPQAKISCTSDIMNIIATGSDSYHCIAAISGTGSVVYANDHRTLHRHGGGGYLLDKLGSGFDIGRDVLRTAFMEEDGVGEKSLITALAKKRLGSTVWEAVPEIYKQGTAFIASFSRVAFDAYRQGDKVAEKILRNNMLHAARIVETGAKQFADSEKITLVLAGGLTKQKQVIDQFRASLKNPEKYEIHILKADPVCGAVILARQLRAKATYELD
jgi:N-acetylglucosamine kinase-like BadF-type ATPase